MNINERIRAAVKAGVKMKTIASKAEVSNYRLASVVNPKKYKGESKFDRFEEERISKALDAISAAFSAQ